MEGFSAKPIDENDADRKINELEGILKQLEDKEKIVKEIHVDCEQYGAQYGDVQKFIRQLLLGLSSNIQVIRENQNFIRSYLENAKKLPVQVVETVHKEEQVIVKSAPVVELKAPVAQEPVEDSRKEVIEQTIVQQKIAPEVVKPETQAMSTQTLTEQSTDNIMVIQSMNSEGETIQIYNMPSSYEERAEGDRNVIVEAKYIRSNSGEPMRASELILKNVPRHFETTFVEPDETTTEIIVDPDGSKRIIVRKLTKTTQQIVKREEYEDGALPEHIRAQLGLSETTHDVIIGSAVDPSFEQHSGITESSIHAVIEHVTHKVIRKTRKIIKKIVIIDGQEHITEEVIEEPDEIEEFSEDRPAIEYEVSDAQIELPVVEEVMIKQEVVAEKPQEVVIIGEVQEKVIEPEEIKPQDEAVPVEKPLVRTQTESQPEPEPKEKQEPISQGEQPEPVGVSEGENNNDQVLEIITEARVELIASDVDKLAPVEDIKNIWPYATPHIASQSANVEITELPAPTQRDNDSQDIWPQNLSIGSKFELDEYSFNRTLEKSSDYLDNDSFLSVDAGLENVSALDSRFAPDDEEDVQQIVEVSDIEPIIEIKEEVKVETVSFESKKIVEEIEEIVEEIKVVPEPVEKPEEQAPEEPESVQEPIKEPEIVEESEKFEEVLKPLEVVVAEKPVTPPLASPPQMATITIVKTMTFLEQEKINAQAMMIVTKQPISEPRINESIVSQADRSMGEEFVDTLKVVEGPQQVSEVVEEVSQIEQSLPVVTPAPEIVKPSEPEPSKPEEESEDVTDKSTVTQVEMIITNVILESDKLKTEPVVQEVVAPVEEVQEPIVETPASPKAKHGEITIVQQTVAFILNESEFPHETTIEPSAPEEEDLHQQILPVEQLTPEVKFSHFLLIRIYFKLSIFLGNV